MAPLVRAAVDGKRPRFIVDDSAVCLLAIPFAGEDGAVHVATAPFVTGELSTDAAVDAAVWCDHPAAEIQEWTREQTVWLPDMLLKFAAAVQGQLAAEARARRAEREIELVSENLAKTYEEISLLYTITQNLRISSTDEELGRLAIERLEECHSAEAFAIQFLPVTSEEDTTGKSRTRPLFLSNGACPVNEQEFTRLIDTLEFSPAGGPYVANRRVTQESTWQFPTVRQFIVVPLVEGENVFGWLAAFNHRAMNVWHRRGQPARVSRNDVGHPRRQPRSLSAAGGVAAEHRRALTSAIDAKDPYTSGHSDRVARVAVRIALELRCDPKSNTIYMSGLLHDVGKIGIDDHVLRKPGRLTDVEFEHIKRTRNWATRFWRTSSNCPTCCRSCYITTNGGTAAAIRTDSPATIFP